MSRRGVSRNSESVGEGGSRKESGKRKMKRIVSGKLESGRVYREKKSHYDNASADIYFGLPTAFPKLWVK